MITFHCAKLIPLGIVNLKCITSPQLFRVLSHYQCEEWKCTKPHTAVKTIQKFYGALALPRLQQLKDDTSNALHSDSERLNSWRDVKKVRSIFGCRPKEAATICVECPAILHLTVKAALEQIEYLATLGIHKSAVKKYPWLLTIKRSALLPKLEILECLKFKNKNEILPLVQASLDYLKAISATEGADRIPNGSRITYLAEKLKCPVSEVCKFILKFEFVYHIPLDRLQQMLQTLTESGVAAKHILADGWILRYNIDVIQERIEELKIASIKVIKPWMLRTSIKNYTSLLQKAEAYQTVLGEETVTDYLARRLECSKEYVKYLQQKNPKAAKVNIGKMHEVFNILFEEGFTPYQIAVHFRVLENSAETTRARIAALRARGIQPYSPAIFIKTNKQFEVLLKKIDNG